MLTQEKLREIIYYDPWTGEVQWKQFKQGRQSGKLVGTKHRYYFVIKINGKQYLLHRIIWFYMTGKWPTHEIDHKDTDGFNNKWENLREANDEQQSRNRHVTYASKTGIKGIFNTRCGHYIARLQYKNKKLNLGTFKTIEEATKVYENKIKELHGEFART